MADFFDRVKQGLGKGATTVSVKSKEMLEVSKLKSQIADVRSKKKDALEELGSITHTMLLKGGINEERLRAKSAAIAAFDEQIKQKENELAEIRARTQEVLGKPRTAAVCVCGAELFEGSKFCGKCGAEVKPPAARATCPQCESPVERGSQFCESCGMKLTW